MTGRPPIWVGHVGPIGSHDPDATIAFYETLGLRLIHRNERIAALQLRGGTHLVVDMTGDVAVTADAPFDLMVDDLDECHRAWGSLAPTPMDRPGNHRRFTLVDPDGRRVAVLDSHVVGVA